MEVRSDLKEKVATSIQRLKAFQPKEGYHLAFSGGKDSCVIKALADMAGVKYEAVYIVTGIDPPELVQFIKNIHPDVKFDIPRYPDGTRVTMWNLIRKKKYPPTRIARFCCQYLKEDAGDGKMTITGVRWAESANRKQNQGIATVTNQNKKDKQDFIESGHFGSTKKGGVILVNDNDESRRMMEQCVKRAKITINPIIDWDDEDVWMFIKEYNIPYCSLYDEGFKRLGCIGCPMASRKGREKEFLRYPKYKELYIKAFDKMLKEKTAAGKTYDTLNNAQDLFNWWMEYDVLPGQVDLFEEV